ncbi:bifunctional 2-polyprenyl-6-hydroxyphenol methylase/3-demethylubiquinol 3-O-methyltransferase UbiG [Nostoc sp. FACHB-133]|uniref:class I SAM-dependent methyltransferase n=1 Tax=Nostoc sp. FACHB-133 TaxID=2692835 RepID=UPI001688C537|nr:class I SAM-dependent methyltransferase [Nostoc sp. FACHB-133]MBD2523524.1 methyltransferase domain-containing protein [Nostoc sp. FACHB-133]
MNTIYEDGTYLQNHPTWHEEDSPWKAKQIAKIIKRNNLNPLTICEIGCGAGEILNSLQTEFSDKTSFYGYEISTNAFEICNSKSNKKLHFFLKDLLNEKEAIFDLVMAIDVFEHVEEYFGFLRKLKEKGKYKLFHIPLDLSVQTVLRSSPILKDRLLYGHIHYFTKETALATLKDTGYEVLDYFYTCPCLELQNRGGWKSSLLNVPRKLLFSINQDLAVRILGRFSLLVLAK